MDTWIPDSLGEFAKKKKKGGGAGVAETLFQAWTGELVHTPVYGIQNKVTRYPSSWFHLKK